MLSPQIYMCNNLQTCRPRQQIAPLFAVVAKLFNSSQLRVQGMPVDDVPPPQGCLCLQWTYFVLIAISSVLSCLDYISCAGQASSTHITFPVQVFRSTNRKHYKQDILTDTLMACRYILILVRNDWYFVSTKRS